MALSELPAVMSSPDQTLRYSQAPTGAEERQRNHLEAYEVRIQSRHPAGVGSASFNGSALRLKSVQFRPVRYKTLFVQIVNGVSAIVKHVMIMTLALCAMPCEIARPLTLLYRAAPDAL